MNTEPLTSPLGVIRAWACGRCGLVHTGDQSALPEPAPIMPQPLLLEAFEAAEKCCTCPQCKGPSCRDRRLCLGCHNAEREARVQRDAATMRRMHEAIARAKGGAR